MMLITLKRKVSKDDGTFGVMSLDGKKIAVTCEDPWNQNAKGKSCIPPGRYRCARFSGKKYKNVWEVRDVPGRSAILIHNGNTIDDTQGCILVGKSFSMLAGKASITDSRLTLEQLRNIFDDEFELLITNPGEDDDV